MLKLKRNIELDILKLLFAIIIMIHHSYQLSVFNGEHIFLKSGALAVDFFFIVSGCVMTLSIMSKNKDEITEAGTFIFRRIKKFFVPVFLAWLACVIIKISTSGIKELKYLLFRAPFELTFTFMFGMGSGVNPMTWFISALIISELLIYPFLQKKIELWINVIGPISVLMIMGNLYHYYGYLGNTYTFVGITYIGVLRAIMGVGSGSLCAALIKTITEKKEEILTPFGIILLNLFKYSLLTIVLLYMQFVNQGRGDFLVFICFCILVVLVFITNIKIKIININFVSELSFAIFINQYVSILLLNSIEFKIGKWGGLMYSIITILLSVMSVLITPKIRTLASKAKKYMINNEV